jgi:regulatory protein
MSVITEISKQKKGNRYNIFLDGEFAVGSSQETLAEFGLYKGKDCTSIKLEDIIKFDFQQRILDKALRLISSSPKTKKNLRFRLTGDLKDVSKEYSIEINLEQLIEGVLEKLENMGFIDDLKFATEFVNSRMNNKLRSIEFIKMELMKKGVDNEIIKQALLEAPTNDLNTARELLIKKYGSDKIQKEDSKKINYLRTKGYNWDIISKFIGNDFTE